jgi:predicted transcriptional regulator
MRKHNGMRPQDIPVLLKIISLEDTPWGIQPLSNSLFISLSEVSESLNRSRIAGLVDHSKKRVNRQSLMEFIEFGVKYVFPQEPSAMNKGMATGLSHPFMKDIFNSEYKYVWPDAKGELVGLVIEPFYDKQPAAARLDPLFYKLLALMDVVRVGKVREVNVALTEIRRIILRES